MKPRTHLGEAMALAMVALRPYAGAIMPPGSLRLQLPPVGPGRSGPFPDPAALRVIAALYLYAEYEQAGLIPVAEVLVASRDTLPIRDVGTAGKMENFFQHAQQWYDRNLRNLLFGNLFGLGPGSEAGGNHDFQRLFASLCLSLTAAASAARFGNSPGAEDAHVIAAALDLLGNLGARQYGSVLVGARTVHDQLAAAVNLLMDANLQAVFQAHGLWDLMQKIVGDQSPDFGRLARRAQNGQRILEWLATATPQLAGSPPRAPVIGAQSSVAGWAAGWLDATGILPSTYATGLVL